MGYSASTEGLDRKEVYSTVETLHTDNHGDSRRGGSVPFVKSLELLVVCQPLPRQRSSLVSLMI